MIYARYRHLAIDQAKPEPTKAQIEAIETLLGAVLPPSFRDFLRVANGGYIEYVVDVPVGNGKTEPLSLCGIFSAEEGDFCDETFIGEIKSEREYKKIPAGVLPFARDGGACVAYLDLSSEGNGKVVVYVHGLPEWTGLRTESMFVEVAKSFDEYVDMHRIDLDAVIDHLMHDATEYSHIDATEEFLDIGMPNWRENSVLVNAVQETRQRITRG